MKYDQSKQFALKLDEEQKTFKSDFLIPSIGSMIAADHHEHALHRVENCIYLCGNSLGLQPKRARILINEELDVWENSGVTGHFRHPHGRPWVSIDDQVTKASAKIVGAKTEKEVAIMNSLTSNLHFLMVPFYTPTPTRFKILMEAKSFPSDYFAFESQVKFHGFDPATAIIQVAPEGQSYTLETQNILDVLSKEGDSIALVLFSGVQYYTGQKFEMDKITKAAKEKGCMVGWDLAHAVGNVELHLHDWNVDFACWCSYKYLNSGPGGIGGAFVHEKHFGTDRPRFAGWWGTEENGKFDMDLTFKPINGANGFRLSNPCVLAVVALKASLDIFEKTTMTELATKSKLLTGYLEFLIKSTVPASKLKIITPEDPNQRGCQLSLLFLVPGQMTKVFRFLEDHGVICDDRKPDVIRIAPTPLYNTFHDVCRAATLIKEGLESI